MFVRSKVVKGHTYYQAVQGYRDESGLVRHRTVASLGREPTLEGAIKAEQRRLAGIRRTRSRYRGTMHTATLRAKVELLERQLAAATAKVELLRAILDGEVPAVDTTATGGDEVVSTRRWSWVDSYRRAKEAIAEDPELADLAPGDYMAIDYLCEFDRPCLDEIKDGRMILGDAFRKFAPGWLVESAENV